MIPDAIGAALEAFERAAVRFGKDGVGLAAAVRARAELVRLIEAELAAARGARA